MMKEPSEIEIFGKEINMFFMGLFFIQVNILPR